MTANDEAGLTDEQWEAIAETLAGRDVDLDHVRRELAELFRGFLMFRARRTRNPFRKERDRWRRIHKLASELVAQMPGLAELAEVKRQAEVRVEYIMRWGAKLSAANEIHITTFCTGVSFGSGRMSLEVSWGSRTRLRRREAARPTAHWYATSSPVWGQSWPIRRRAPTASKPSLTVRVAPESTRTLWAGGGPKSRLSEPIGDHGEKGTFAA